MNTLAGQENPAKVLGMMQALLTGGRAHAAQRQLEVTRLQFQHGLEPRVLRGRPGCLSLIRLGFTRDRIRRLRVRNT